MKEHINRILYRYDLLMTGCKENQGMEDEYQDVATELIRYMEDNAQRNQQEPAQLKEAFDQCFSENMLEDMGALEKTSGSVWIVNRYFC